MHAQKVKNSRSKKCDARKKNLFFIIWGEGGMRQGDPHPLPEKLTCPRPSFPSPTVLPKNVDFVIFL